MVLVLWLARLLDRTSLYAGRAANAVYRVHFGHEKRKNQRAADWRAREEQKRVDAAIDDVTGARARRGARVRVGAPIHRDR
jgi:hypothetical protein